MSEQETERRVEQKVSEFVETMAALNITLTEDEIEAKRRELLSAATGETALVYTPEGVPDVETWEEVSRLPAGDVAVLDDFQKLDDKSRLVNVPFFVKQWWFVEGEMGPFAVMRCIASVPINTGNAEPTQKLVVTDGSTGIHEQLREVTKRTGKTTALLVRNGLRRSEYTADTDEGPKLAETYYLT